MDDETSALFALRLEYVAARRELEAIREARRAGDEREARLADRVMSLYLRLYEKEHGLKEEP